MTCSTIESEAFNCSVILHIVSLLLTAITRSFGNSDDFGLGTFNAGEADVFGSVKTGLIGFFAINLAGLSPRLKFFDH